ncbi:MAG: SUMF1/EgtB/PvdO family nonheme iron enzyme, partial [Planctomycetota bacterium]
MNHFSTSLSRLAFRLGGSALAVSCSLASPTLAQAPPGLVEIDGGRAKIGVEKKVVEKLLKENVPLRKRAAAIWSATPEHTLQLQDYYLMVTEVTNEQYAEFVRATDSKPPEKWGEQAINDARAAFLEEDGAMRQKLKEEGKPVPAAKKFDETVWWNENWSTAQWEIPEGKERKPVAYIDHTGARSYARWAGLRLPTEFELQRAARGLADKDQLYPWGKNWEEGRAATSEVTGVRGTLVVGSFPEGASKEGIHDLIGNVWEWTS